MRYHHVSIFGPGPRVPLDREQQAVFRAKLKLARRPGRLTIAGAEIGRVLLNMMGADGRLDPMLDTIAKKARVCRSTVQRALDQLKALGFLDWTRRLVRDRDGTRQTSNAYVLMVPKADGHFAIVGISKVYKKVARLTEGRQLAQEERKHVRERRKAAGSDGPPRKSCRATGASPWLRAPQRRQRRKKAA